MPKDLKITLIQSDIHWQDIDANLAMFEEKIWQVEEQPDIILLPETFNTGFTNKTKNLAEMMNMKTFRWMKQMASQSKSIVAGSLMMNAEGKFYNRFVWMQPDGGVEFYDKRHLFSLTNEDQYFTPGKKRLIIELKGWKICPLICYDLRFPGWSRNRWYKEKSHEFDLLIYVANWPAPRIHAWDVLLASRAIENQCFVAGNNRVGTDDKNNVYPGHSSVFDGLGQRILFAGTKEEISTVDLSYTALETLRENLPFYKDADHIEIQN